MFNDQLQWKIAIEVSHQMQWDYPYVGVYGILQLVRRQIFWNTEMIRTFVHLTYLLHMSLLETLPSIFNPQWLELHKLTWQWLR
jgi:hypothetical protein